MKASQQRAWLRPEGQRRRQYQNGAGALRRGQEAASAQFGSEGILGPGGLVAPRQRVGDRHQGGEGTYQQRGQESCRQVMAVLVAGVGGAGTTGR